MNSRNLILIFSLLTSPSYADDSFDCTLAMTTLQATYPNVDPAGLSIKNGTGRAEVNAAVNFSYYIQSNQSEPTVMIPMSSSRLGPGWVSTPEWWQANLDKINQAKAAGQPMPYEDKDEVQGWLDKNGLSTNPNVFFLSTGTVDHKPLQDFLLDFLSSNAVNEGDFYYLYRGAVKADERAQWVAKTRPSGARYWTPSADYAWRYGRKQAGFLHALVKGEAPVLKFKIPRKEFEWLVQNKHLVLGTELTAKVHDTFDTDGMFMDQLMGGPYVGSGEFAPEIEIRASRKSAEDFVQYFDGSVGIQELVDERVKLIQLAIARVKTQYMDSISQPQIEHLNQRIARTKAEGALLLAIQEHHPIEEVNALYQALPPGNSEISNNDADPLEGLMKDYQDGKI